jgi:hypothetical protein
MKKIALPLLLACSAPAWAQPAGPVLEKDPWAGFKTGSSIKVRRGTAEYTLTLSEYEGQRTLARDPEEEEFDGSIAFAGFASSLRADGSGYKRTGKSATTVKVGAGTAKALVEEFTAGDGDDTSSADKYRVTTCDDVPGGVVRVERDSSAESAREKWVYELKAVEKLKVGGKDLECWRFDLTASEGKKKTTTSCWLSKEVPGLLVRVKAPEIVRFEVLEFKAEK